MASMGNAADALVRLHQQYDERIRLRRAQEDADLQAQMNDTSNPMGMQMAIQAKNAQVFNRSQEDMAEGPNGFNRQWAGVPFAKGIGHSGLPIEGSPDSLTGLRAAASGTPDTDTQWLAKNPLLKKRLTELA